MLTKADGRQAVRRRLEDVAMTPLWSDTDLDDAMSNGLALYSAISPLEERTTVTLGSGVRSFSVIGLERGDAIRRVIDPAGDVVAPGVAEQAAAPGQGWRWWAGAIWLAKPALGGDWIVEWHRARLLPAIDTDPLPILTGDEAAVVLLAGAAALNRRAVEEAKRGNPLAEQLLRLATAWQQTGQMQTRSPHRRVTAFIAGTR